MARPSKKLREATSDWVIQSELFSAYCYSSELDVRVGPFPSRTHAQEWIDGPLPTISQMVATQSERGFSRLDHITCTYDSDVSVYESSAASAPYIWLNVKCNPQVLKEQAPGEGTAHLTLRQAELLARQLKYMIRNHYQKR